MDQTRCCCDLCQKAFYVSFRSFIVSGLIFRSLIHCEFIFLSFFFFALCRAASSAYGGSQARGPIRAVATGPRQSQSHSNVGSEPASATYTTAHVNARSLTHRARPGTKPATSWFLVGSVNHCAAMRTPVSLFLCMVLDGVLLSFF